MLIIVNVYKLKYSFEHDKGFYIVSNNKGFSFLKRFQVKSLTIQGTLKKTLLHAGFLSSSENWFGYIVNSGNWCMFF